MSRTLDWLGVKVVARQLVALVVPVALAAGTALACACASEPVLVLDVTAERDAERLRVAVKAPGRTPAFVREFDVDPSGLGRDLTDPADAYRIALRLAANGEWGVHIVDAALGVPTQAWADWLTVDGETQVSAQLVVLSDGDGDGWPGVCPLAVPNCLLDCDDADPGTNPFAVDVCGNGLDEDCGGGTPEGAGVDRACEDLDGDGFAEGTGGDCDDDNAEVFPGQRETATTCDSSEPRCDDGIDHDCDGADPTCHTDADCDGGWPMAEVGGTDCDDLDAAIGRHAMELCGDGIDQDCDGVVDGGCAPCDEDGDGAPGHHAERGCDAPPELVDCDDANRGVHPGATLDCGGDEGAPACAARGTCALPARDEDCDGVANEGCPAPACDLDGDGYARADCSTPPPPGAADCDDSAQIGAAFHPGAPDVCGDGLAQNCSIDLPCSEDRDGDGYAAGADCDDRDPEVHPGQVERCDGRDEDCDGVIDEGNPGGERGTTLVGASCTFDDDGECGTGFGRCVCGPTPSDGRMDPGGLRALCPGESNAIVSPRCFGARQPQDFERCDNAGADLDCDGRADDPSGATLHRDELGLPCHGLPSPCVQGVVIGCDQTVTHAHYDRSHWLCSPDEHGPETELCNAIDDDCNMTIDDGFHTGLPCDGDDGDFCAEGSFACDLAGGEVCSDATATSVELCNAFDDDCDGVVDDGFPGLTSSCDGPDADLCHEGTIVCDAAGTGTRCTDTSADNTEVCNGVDDDCDGLTDEGYLGLGLPCDGLDSDVCQEGTSVCAGGGATTTCSDATGNSVETCNGVDDDCDGLTDETFAGLGSACDGADSDLCQEGNLVCAGGGASTTCSDATGNTVERCDNLLDDDCDGSTNEGFPGLGLPCDGTDADFCATGTMNCDGSGITANCSDGSSSISEVCNGADDNCDGFTDEGFLGLGLPCDGLDSDVCQEGTTVCAGGGATTTCSDATGNSVETCNGVDDDCDGLTDQTFAGLGSACDGADDDFCTTGTTVCAGGGGSTVCNDDSASTAESCNGVDDDCDGSTDEGAGPACAPTGDTCTGGVCRCGTGTACAGTRVCTMGTCM